jgi:hypothetical protein
MNLDQWEKFTSFGNLYEAFRAAARSRRSRSAVAGFEFNLEENLITLQQELRDGCYIPGAYTNFLIHDPKRRLISAAPFRDRVVHHALCNIIEPAFERKFIFDSYANRVGKGTHRALDRCTQFMRKFTYVLPIDIVQYFPSIDHLILYDILKAELHDLNILRLCKQIIDSGKGIHTNLPRGIENKGLPIGNLTSQFWANVYLNPLDHFIKRELKCRGYIRYVDDMLLFADSKKELWVARDQVVQILERMALSIHSTSSQPRPTYIGIPFLGFQVFRDHRRLKHQKVSVARRRFKLMMEQYHRGEFTVPEIQQKTISWLNHARYGDTWGLRKKMLENIVL